MVSPAEKKPWRKMRSEADPADVTQGAKLRNSSRAGPRPWGPVIDGAHKPAGLHGADAHKRLSSRESWPAKARTLATIVRDCGSALAAKRKRGKNRNKNKTSEYRNEGKGGRGKRRERDGDAPGEKRATMVRERKS